MSEAILLLGNCLDTLKDLPDNSVDSVVTDPPYGLAFMGKKWDYDVPSIEIWKEVLRVLKPGGHLLSFGGTRTYHRMVVAIEDAGFEIRDQIQWLYGSGFPKSHDISKAIDKAAGAEREVVGINANVKGRSDNRTAGQVKAAGNASTMHNDASITAPATPEAKQWQGWGTALKPANEPIVLARKPLEKGLTIAENVLKYGTGGLNIDATRIEAADQAKFAKNWDREKLTDMRGGNYGNGVASGIENNSSAPQGRFPANIILDEVAAEMLDEQSGNLGKSAGGGMKRSGTGNNVYSTAQGHPQIKNVGHGDSGGASRFFYVAKASKRERGEGNVHPTVKPIKLMEYLIKLITPANGIVLDPFMGSGTTGVAAKNLNFDFIGCEMSDEYIQIAEKRINNDKKAS